MQTDALPGAFAGLLLSWYVQNARELPWRKNTNAYCVWLSEIMLQQTRVETVKEYYTRFLARYPTVQHLAAAPLEEVFKLWEGLGYYTRARNLHKCAQIVVAQYGGIFPNTEAQLLRLPGIGAYTAGAIASICFNLPTPAVDGNVLRVVARVAQLQGDIASTATKAQVTQMLRGIYPPQAGLFTQSLMELGATVCMPGTQPCCTKCPVSHLCGAFLNGTQSVFPVKSPKPPKRPEDISVFVLRCNGKIALCKREEHGLLAGMWQLPNVQGHVDATQVLDTIANWGAQPQAVLKVAQKKHVFTHIVWNLSCFFVECGCESPQFVWATQQELSARYALPTAFKKCLFIAE